MTSPTVAPQGPPEPRGCLATLAVLAVMLGIVGGGFAAAGAVAGAPSRPIAVAAGVVVTPLPGWEFGGRSEDGRGILLSNGGGSLAVLVTMDRPEPVAALAALLAEWRADPGTQITSGPIEPSRVRPSDEAAEVSYAGTYAGLVYPVEGEVTAVRGASNTVLFDGWAGEGDFAAVRADIDGMIREAVIP